MSYTEQAEKINNILKLELSGKLGKETEEKVINAMLWFGQVAKFRCRSNVAYDSFAKECFKDIVELSREQNDNLDFAVLKVKNGN